MTKKLRTFFKLKKPEINILGLNLTGKLLIAVFLWIVIGFFTWTLIAKEKPREERETITVQGNENDEKVAKIPGETSGVKNNAVQEKNKASQSVLPSSQPNNQFGNKSTRKSEAKKFTDKEKNWVWEKETVGERVPIPDYMVRFNGNINHSQGSFKFNITPDWQEKENAPLIYANFNGHSSLNILAIGASGPMLVFENYNENGEPGYDSTFVDLGSDYFGKTYDIEIVWNFEISPPVKRIYINNNLAIETNPENITNVKNNEVFIGKIENFEVQQRWSP